MSELRTLKNKDLQDYYDAKFEMFATKGWKVLQEEVDRLLETVRDINFVNPQASLDFRLGQQDMLLWLSKMRDICDTAHGQLLDDQDADEAQPE